MISITPTSYINLSMERPLRALGLFPYPKIGWISLLPTLERWRPDILAIKDKDGVIFDAQVRAEGYDLDRLHDEKVDEYRLAPGLIDTIKEIHDLETLKCEAITFARRGQISPKCYKALRVYFNPRQLGFLSRVVLHEDVTIWWAWNSSVRRAISSRNTQQRIPHVPDPTYPHEPA